MLTLSLSISHSPTRVVNKKFTQNTQGHEGGRQSFQAYKERLLIQFAGPATCV